MDSTILDLIQSAWTTQIKRDFEDGLIVSERELQACLYMHMRQQLSRPGFADVRIYVEPTIFDPKGKRYPDMIVASTSQDSQGDQRIIAIIELKIDRGKYIRFQQEIDRIERFKFLSAVTMRNDRPDSASKETILQVDERTRFFMGFIGSSEAAATYPQEIRKRDSGFADRNPELACRTTILYGRIHVGNKENKFGSENFLESNTKGESL